MTFKAFILGSLCMGTTLFATAQDKIYKKNGDVLNGKVVEVNKRVITYKRAENPNGPNYAIDKVDVQKVRYENGSEDIFDQDGRPGMRAATARVDYGKNVIAIAAFQATEHGIGFGLSYERALDKDGIISFYLPLAVTYNVDNNDPYYYGPYPGYNNYGYSDPFFYTMPGVKFYPTGMYGKVRYGVGPSILLCAGQSTEYAYDYMGNYYVVEKDRFKLGMMVNNSLNINATKHLYLGLELGLGITYLNRENGYNRNVDGLVQFAFRGGYRF